MAGTKASTSTTSTNPAAERIRENQRRSRARRKEFVEGMQRRLDEYERQGVEATLQMQQAARAVAIENARLRMLLARRGVGPDEIDKFLAVFDRGIVVHDEDELAAAAVASLSTSTQQQHYTIASRVPSAVEAAASTYACAYKPPFHLGSSGGGGGGGGGGGQDGGIDRLAVLAEASIGDSRCGSSSSGPGVTTPSESTVAAQSRPPSAEPPGTMPGTPVSLSHGPCHGHPPPQSRDYTTSTTPQPPGSASPLVMSCNTAAQIIAEMQGGAAAPTHKHAVRASLGYQDDEYGCLMKNALLFQIMERNGA